MAEGAPHVRIVNLETSITRSDAFEPKVERHKSAVPADEIGQAADVGSAAFTSKRAAFAAALGTSCRDRDQNATNPPGPRTKLARLYRT